MKGDGEKKEMLDEFVNIYGHYNGLGSIKRPLYEDNQLIKVVF